MVNDKTAERAFFMLVNDENSTVFKSPKDFSLYCIGSFDDANPAVSTFMNPVLVGRALSYVQRNDLISNPVPQPGAKSPGKKSKMATCHMLNDSV
jgi:hypothetical protein